MRRTDRTGRKGRKKRQAREVTDGDMIMINYSTLGIIQVERRCGK